MLLIKKTVLQKFLWSALNANKNLFFFGEFSVLLRPVVDMLIWCGREDLNFHPVARTATSTLRVYQFRHDRTIQHCPFVQIKVARGKYEFNNY